MSQLAEGNAVRAMIPEPVFREVATHLCELVDGAGYPNDLATLVLHHLSGKGRLLPEGRFSPWPFLTLLSYETASGGPANAAIPAAAGIEILVACADLIDDVQDGELEHVERKEVSDVLEVVWVLNFLCEESLLGSTNRGIAPERALDAARRMSGWSLRAMGGQHRDIAWEGADGISLRQSLEMTALKSASLTCCATEVGASLATSEPTVIDLYRDFGRRLGMVGQLMNDIAAVWPGGPRKSDLQLRKKTPPIVAGLEAASRGDERAFPVARFYGGLRGDCSVAGDQDEDAVKWALWDCGAIQRTWEAAALERAAAHKTIEDLGQHIPNAGLLKRLID